MSTFNICFYPWSAVRCHFGWMPSAHFFRLYLWQVEFHLNSIKKNNSSDFIMVLTKYIILKSCYLMFRSFEWLVFCPIHFSLCSFLCLCLCLCVCLSKTCKKNQNQSNTGNYRYFFLLFLPLGTFFSVLLLIRFILGRSFLTFLKFCADLFLFVILWVL